MRGRNNESVIEIESNVKPNVQEGSGHASEYQEEGSLMKVCNRNNNEKPNERAESAKDRSAEALQREHTLANTLPTGALTNYDLYALKRDVVDFETGDPRRNASTSADAVLKACFRRVRKTNADAIRCESSRRVAREAQLRSAGAATAACKQSAGGGPAPPPPPKSLWICLRHSNTTHVTYRGLPSRAHDHRKAPTP
ncbi:hypothetical protein EVAR_10869_1 [Eumeta japonica]|uniref:Uncharacterized protein n=1 Tax=Eumeta variegata TaxID=151549 RepID=A0A4C1URE7_EUMVA|nr:hypothetical protein EVAR_10869_1 [Eumeta japonica]